MVASEEAPEVTTVIRNANKSTNSMTTLDCNESFLDLEQSTQHLKDFKLAIEFKYLMKHAPGGVFLMPQFDDIRRLDGVIFLRRGLYRDGVFRFQMSLPHDYNGWNSHPRIIFNPPIYNPLIDPETGELDLKVEEGLREWIPEKHFCVTALIFLKKIFYMKSFENYEVVGNEEARLLFQMDRDAYLVNIRNAVKDSLARMYDRQNKNCSICFSRPIPAHDIIRSSILGSNSVDDESTVTDLSSETKSGATAPKKLPFYDVSNEAEDAEDRERRMSLLESPDEDS